MGKVHVGVIDHNAWVVDMCTEHGEGRVRKCRSEGG